MMKLSILLIAALGLVSSAAVNVNRTETAVPEMRMTGSGTFQQGSDTCRSWGMWPLSIHNEATQRAAWDLCPENCYFGLRRSTAVNGPAWYYDDGSVYDYTAWDRGQPGPSETVCTMYRPGRTPTVSWHDWGTGGSRYPMICGNGAASESPMPSNSPAASSSQTSSPSVTPSSSQTPSVTMTATSTSSVTMTATSTSSASMSASNTPGVCRPYCVGDFGLCQNPLWEDFTCYAHDNAGNCPVNTVSCPNVVEADTVVLCQSCAMGTSGSCQHPENGVCAEHLDTGVCPPNFIFCGSSF